MRALLDLVLPVHCGGCATAGTAWCADCADILSRAPVRVRPRTDPGVPCWALGPYQGPGRRAVLAAKEHGRRDLAAPLGLALALALARLRDRDRPLLLVPAPTRPAAARRRGGDPVAGAAAMAARWLIDSRCVPLLRMGRGVRDSVGLSAGERADNLRGRIMTARGVSEPAVPAANSEVVVVDDVLTTGATVTESVRVLGRIGVSPCAVLVTCAA
ncbi:ComF family protein [Nocardia asteroides NBRC 15531]|uniref:ComF family protein n=1 Tax=Nocardia asteroides TaxID=1824 RepID=UPI0004C248D7|nr:ComF family protein [Nocardia asteroides]TLF70190.1 ComF family protein [Nocardia asteroides NBRC 15531]UGT49719.1 ComF family protein [Nocardia asteroides]SFL99376.1 Predicted amidophosphoribosyltransferases [Nocardia asteroides]VEG37556.1 DNA utilization protein GntX [Nocardia asteroides]